jgi:hypothetical protein
LTYEAVAERAVIAMIAVGTYPVHVDATLDGPPSRWLWLVMWILLIPDSMVLALLWLASVLLSAVAFVAILVTGIYLEQIFDFVLGMNRWVLRVAAYAGLMTDQYPPFRLDMGGREPGGTLTVPPQPPPWKVTPDDTLGLKEQPPQAGPSGSGSPAPLRPASDEPPRNPRSQEAEQ